MKTRYKITTLVFAIAFLVFLPHSNLLDKVEGTFTQKTVLEKTNTQNTTVQETPKKDHSAQKTQLIADISNYMGVNQQFAVSVYDINNNESFGVNETQAFHSASVTKLLVATTALVDVEKGKYKLNQPAAGYTFVWQLEQMINQSNNNSWDYFNNLLGFKREQQEADSLSLPGVDIFQTHMTTQGVAQLLLKLYKGDVLTTEHRDLLFGFMQNTETENRITTGIPKGVNFYHKTGTFNGEIHDAAIVINPKNPFVLVIFTDDGTGLNWDTRFASFKKTTQAVYEYFSNI